MRASIGLAGQYAAVDENLTARENLRLVGRLTHISDDEHQAAHRRAARALRPADAGDRLVRTFSGGMRRRLDLAAALVHRAAGALPRRADDRPRPAGPHRAVGGDRGPRRRAARRCCSRRSTSRRPTGSPTHRRDRPRLGDRRGHRGASSRRDMGATVIEVGFGDDAQPVAARRALAADRRGERPRAHVLRVNVADGADRDARDGPRPRRRAARRRSTMALREPTLDDVFLDAHRPRGGGARREPTTTPDDKQRRGRRSRA